jgi:hypothetical protein
MINRDDVILPTGDATLLRYTRSFDSLTLEFTLWDESIKSIAAQGVTFLEDRGTWEAEALIRFPSLDQPSGKKGFAIIDTDDTATLLFIADRVDID